MGGEAEGKEGKGSERKGRVAYGEKEEEGKEGSIGERGRGWDCKRRRGGRSGRWERRGRVFRLSFI